MKQQRSKSSFVSSWCVERIGRWFKGSGRFEILVRERRRVCWKVVLKKTKLKSKTSRQTAGNVRKATGTTYVAMYQHLIIYAEKLVVCGGTETETTLEEYIARRNA